MTKKLEIIAKFRAFAVDCRGSSLVEFGLILPVILFLLMAGIDVGRLALANLKIYNAAASMADLASRDKTLTAASLNDLFGAAAQIMQPFDIAADGTVIITGVSADVDNDPRIFWQSTGGGSLVAGSTVGAVVGDPAVLPAGIAMDAQETIIVAEVFYRFEPLFGIPISTTTITHSAFYRPRLGTLRAIE